MIQRIQTVWWGLSEIIIGAYLFLPFASIGEHKFSLWSFGGIDDDSVALGILITKVVSICILISTIFSIALFRNRNVQIRISYFTIALIVLLGAGVVYFVSSAVSVNPRLQIWAALPILSFIFQILAIRSVKKDEALIKSMDRLR